MDNLVTVFIPTHNRHKLLLRNLAWLEKSKCRIVIADSSKSSLDDEIKKLNSTPNFKSKISYLYENGLDYYTKIDRGLSLIETPYTIMCPDDDFIIWQNIKFFVAEAVKTGAQTVVGRDLLVMQKNNSFDVCESSEYRKFCIKNQGDILSHLKSAMFPIVCTYYQLYKTSMIQDLWSHMETNKVLMPGNKLAEIVFRSGCFINGPVVFCNKILRVMSDEPSLRTYDNSDAIQKYALNFWEEAKYVKDNGMFSDFVDVIATYLSKHHPGYSANSRRIALDLIVQPMFRRMKSKHEILWQLRYTLGFDFSIDKDHFVRSNESFKYVFALNSDAYRLPEYFVNLDSYFLYDETEWNKLTSLLYFLKKYKI